MDLPPTVLYSGAIAMSHKGNPSKEAASTAGPMAVKRERAPVWEPDPDAAADAAINRFIGMVTATSGRRFDGYHDLWTWSVEHLEEFWPAVWEFFGISAGGDPTTVVSGAAMPGAGWFPQTQLNYAATRTSPPRSRRSSERAAGWPSGYTRRCCCRWA
jgi:acetoacetyl-CoA synthetase